MQDPHAQRGGRGRVDQPRLAVRLRRADGPVDDAFVAELGAVEERVEGVDQPLVAAPVRRQRRLGDGAVGGAEVGVDVGSAEGVHRLLWVADQDQRRLSLAEGAPHDLPLDRVGVLELVDERDAVLLAQLRAGGGAVLLVGERVPEPGEQVVVGHDPAASLARLDLVADGLREAAPHRPRLRLVSRASLDRLEAGERVADRRLGRSAGPRPGRTAAARLGGSGARRGRRRPPRRDRRGPRRTSRRARRRRRRRVPRARAGRSRAWSRSWRRRSPRRHRRAGAAAPPPRRRGHRRAARARGRPRAARRRRARVRVPARRSRAGRAPARAARRSPSA